MGRGGVLGSEDPVVIEVRVEDEGHGVPASRGAEREARATGEAEHGVLASKMQQDLSMKKSSATDETNRRPTTY